MASSHRHLAEMLAAVFSQAPIDPPSIELRVKRLLGKRYRWVTGVTQRYVRMYPKGQLRPRHKHVVAWLLADSGFRKACERHSLEIVDAVLEADGMLPISAAERWTSLRPLATLGELTEWLVLQPSELEWFVDRKRLTWRASSERLWHYRCRILEKRFGQVRLIEAPKPRLKAIQIQILREIIDHIPPHAAAHGFRSGHSIATFAEPHVRQPVVISMDLTDFFPTIRLSWVEAIFRTVGFPEQVSNALAGLCVTAMPCELWNRYKPKYRSLGDPEQWYRYSQPHLPQGAPTSPALANLAAFRLDCRLTGLASSAGVNYTRYADDLVFSGGLELARRSRQFATNVAVIVQEEGFMVNYRKTRVMRSGGHQRVAGVVVNDRLNGQRVDFDRLKALLTNCVRHGPISQNRQTHPEFREHLLGKIAHWKMLNPDRGLKLMGIFDQINWGLP